MYQNTVPYPFPSSYPLAMGCGDVYALTLLDAGYSPHEAVKASFKREAHAGGEIQVVNIAEALGQLREAAE